jgi:DNA primase
MALFTKESLELLRSRSDLVDVVSAHIDLKKSGSAFKALCPFHEEKSPSFTLQRGDTHYHCFGCGAHGDAIQFIMDYQKITFAETVEYLAARFQVPLKQEESKEDTGINKNLLKDALEAACRFYSFMLLYSKEGRFALNYLFERGIDLAFIRHFHLGFAPKTPWLFKKYMNSLKFSDDTLIQAGLLATTKNGDQRDFFSDRITFPIRNAMGSCIGFSARKFKEDTFGGKYINTSETSLFKKSSILFGLNYSRRRIAKERKVILVEGQIDALRLIQEGFNFTVASLGTAFTEWHVKDLLQLGVNLVYVAFDSDRAGKEAAIKVGNLFQKEGIEVFVASIKNGKDPDDILKDGGPEAIVNLLENAKDYLTFLVENFSEKINVDSPAGKTELVQNIKEQIKAWNKPIMIHESLKKVGKLLNIPSTALGLEEVGKEVYFKKSQNAGFLNVDADLILEMDVLRWLLLLDDKKAIIAPIYKKYLSEDCFQNEACRALFNTYIKSFDEKKPSDLLSLAIDLNQSSAAQEMLNQILQKKVNREKPFEGICHSIQKILERQWMQKREEVRIKILSDKHSEDEVLQLAKLFDEIKKNPPKVVIDENTFL